MTLLDDENESLSYSLGSEVPSEVSDEVEPVPHKPEAKRLRLEEEGGQGEDGRGKRVNDAGRSGDSGRRRSVPVRMETGTMGSIPLELLPHILKFLSCEDLVSCSLVCRCLNFAATDESLWRRLYCIRWGLLRLKNSPLECAWKNLYIQRDKEDLVKLLGNCEPEFKKIYSQMHAAKRSQAPLPSQVKDDWILLNKTVSDQVSIWKRSRGFTNKVILNHACSGETCSYHQIGDVFVCEKTGNVHVCDNTCREIDIDPTYELVVCKISGRCFDKLLSSNEMEPDAMQQKKGGTADGVLPEIICSRSFVPMRRSRKPSRFG